MRLALDEQLCCLQSSRLAPSEETENHLEPPHGGTPLFTAGRTTVQALSLTHSVGLVGSWMLLWPVLGVHQHDVNWERSWPSPGPAPVSDVVRPVSNPIIGLKIRQETNSALITSITHPAFQVSGEQQLKPLTCNSLLAFLKLLTYE